MLLLTLTISTFQEDGTSFSMAGDYAAVFPLLVVSCFVSLMVTRGVVFYKQQRCRGDIIASPEVLCEPGKVGQPMMHFPMAAYEDDYGSMSDSYDGSDINSGLLEGSSFEEIDDEERMEGGFNTSEPAYAVEHEIRLKHQDSTRCAFSSTSQANAKVFTSSSPSLNLISKKSKLDAQIEELLNSSIESVHTMAGSNQKRSHRRVSSVSDVMLSNLEDIGESSGRKRSYSYDQQGETVKNGRGNKSSDAHRKASRHQRTNSRDSLRSVTPTQGVLMRVDCKGNIEDFQPSLMDQGRIRASSARQPNLPKPSPHFRRPIESVHSRNSSEISVAIPQDEIERAFRSSAVNHSSPRK
jgi:hypothetical protein